MKRRRFLASSAALPFAASAMAEDSVPSWQPKLEEIRVRYDLPALGAAIVTSAGLRNVAVVGMRKKGTEIAATPNDLWHLGSNTKAMTSTLAARAVEAGKIDWNTPLGEVHSGRKSQKSSPLLDATLTDFLSHWSGLPANPAWADLARGGGDMRSQREAAVKLALELEDLPRVGETHLYSNWGYVVAGHMLEKTLDQPWEDLMRGGIFSPLGIERAGFGGTGTPGEIDQPWPHGEDGKPMLKNGPKVDNRPVLGPAGTVHMSLGDWAKFIAEHLAGRKGQGKLLKAATYEHLHTAVREGNPYAYGWLDLERSWGGRVLTHGGSNTMNKSVAWLAPEKDFAVIACTNQGGARKALDDVAGLLIGEV